MFQDFKAFIAKGNVLDLAVAVNIGAAFSAAVTSMVNDMVMSPIGLLLGGVDFKIFHCVEGLILTRHTGRSQDGRSPGARGWSVPEHGHELPDRLLCDLPHRSGGKQVSEGPRYDR